MKWPVDVRAWVRTETWEVRVEGSSFQRARVSNKHTVSERMKEVGWDLVVKGIE